MERKGCAPQFRKAEFGEVLEFVAFDSDEGQKLLDQYMKDLQKEWDYAQSRQEVCEIVDEMDAIDQFIRVKRNCRNCGKFISREEMEDEKKWHDIPMDDQIPDEVKGVCEEGGFSEIGDPECELSEDDCSAWIKKQ